MVKRAVVSAGLSVIGAGLGCVVGALWASAVVGAGGGLAGPLLFGLGGIGVLLALLPSRWIAPSTRLAAVLSWLALGPFVFVAALAAVSATIVSSHFVCGTPMAAAIMLVPPVAGGALLVSAVVLRGALHRRRSAWALAGIALSAALGTLALVHGELRGREGVEPDGWVTALPVVAEADAAAVPSRFGPFVVERSVEQGEELVGFRPIGRADDGYAESYRYDPATRIELRRDDRAGFHVLRVGEHTVLALRDGDDHFSDVRVADVRAQLVAPRAWVVLAAVAAAAALVLLAVSLVAGRRPRWLATARPAEVEDDSRTLVFLDGALPARGSARTLLPPGPALALVPAGLPTYRTDGTTGPVDARAGARSEHVLHADARGALWAALALVVTTLGALPLLAAMLVLG